MRNITCFVNIFLHPMACLFILKSKIFNFGEVQVIDLFTGCAFIYLFFFRIVLLMSYLVIFG